jgi:hypothetical protein
MAASSPDRAGQGSTWAVMRQQASALHGMQVWKGQGQQAREHSAACNDSSTAPHARSSKKSVSSVAVVHGSSIQCVVCPGTDTPAAAHPLPQLHQVLDTFCYAERELLASWPKLAEAPVYIHFQSHMQVGTSCAAVPAQQVLAAELDTASTASRSARRVLQRDCLLCMVVSVLQRALVCPNTTWPCTVPGGWQPRGGSPCYELYAYLGTQSASYTG